MTRFTITLLVGSAAMFALYSAYRWWRTRRHLLFAAEIGGVALLLSAVNYYTPLSRPVVTFGAPEGSFIVVAFAFVVVGMVAQYFFDLLGQPAGSRQIDWARFLKPLFVSPIVFLPLLGLIQDAPTGSQGAAHFVVWLNAFQNGFFWSAVYEKVQASIGRPDDAARRTGGAAVAG